jgi:hypothetical protein
MELKLQPEIRAAVEIDGTLAIDFNNSMVYENIDKEEAFFYIKTPDDSKQIKIRFVKPKKE